MIRKLRSWPTKPILLVMGTSFVLLEASLQLLLRTNTLKIHGVLQHPNISRKLFESYIASRNPIVGWPSSLAHGQLFTESGFRPSPASRLYSNKKPCLAVFGDSQGYGLDVSDSAAWTNILAEKLKCPVENYSVPAYGTDQALLRYEQVKPTSDVVLLTFIDDNIRRNLLQFWDLAYGPIYIERTKPRFILKKTGDLSFIDLPVKTYSEAEALNKWQLSDLMRHETFRPSSTIYKTAFQPSFPYSASLARNAIVQIATKHAESGFVKSSFLSGFIDKRVDPIESIHRPSSLLLHSAILRRFIDVCTLRGQKCLIVRLGPNFRVPSLEASSTVSSFLDSKPELSKYLVSSSFMAECLNRILINKWKLTGDIDKRMPGGHYGNETNDALAICTAPLVQKLINQKSTQQ